MVALQARRIPLLLYTFLLQLLIASLVHASSLSTTRSYNDYTHINPRDTFVISNLTGTPEVINSDTQLPIQQSPATDGAGQGFDAAALIWIVFSLVVGILMACVGIRGWRLTTGIGIGLSASVCVWAALCNSLGQASVSDIILTAIVMSFFVFGCLIGVFEFGRLIGLACLGATGGLALGIRIMLLRPGLLFGTGSVGYPAGWVICGLMGLFGVAMLVWDGTQRVGLLFSCASIGTFLTFLGVDLIVNKQDGMSRGLRVFFDRNSSHILDLVTHGYNPPKITFVLIGISLGIIPILAYAQHRMFTQPFRRKSHKREELFEGYRLSNDRAARTMDEEGTRSPVNKEKDKDTIRQSGSAETGLTGGEGVAVSSFSDLPYSNNSSQAKLAKPRSGFIAGLGESVRFGKRS